MLRSGGVVSRVNVTLVVFSFPAESFAQIVTLCVPSLQVIPVMFAPQGLKVSLEE